MPVQCLFTKYIDQQENSTVIHNTQKEDENIKDYEKLFITNGLLKILIADVDDLLRSIECKNSLSIDQGARGEISCENNQVGLQSTDCKNIPSSVQPNLSIKEGHITCGKNHEVMLSSYCNTSSDQSDYCVTGQIICEHNQESRLLVNTNFKIIPNSKQSDLSIKGQINCVNNQKCLFNTDCNTVSSFEQPDLNMKGQMYFENNQDNSLKIYCKTSSSSDQPDSNAKGQINCDKNKENLLNDDFKNRSSSREPDSNDKGQINCHNNQENLLKTDCNNGSRPDQPVSNAREKINCEKNQENSLNTDCENSSNFAEQDSNIKGPINCDNNQDKLLKTDCKTVSDSRQLDLRIKCRIFCEYQDLESLNEYFQGVVENKEDTNVVFQIRSAEELPPTNEEKSRCYFKYFSEEINSLSMFCSFVGMGLYGGIFFGLADVLEYRNIEILSECAHYMVISAVILFFLALLLSFFQEDSKENNSVVVHQTTVRETVLLENSYCANVNTVNETLMADELKCTKSNNEIKPGTITEISKPTNTSSKTPKVDETSKHDEIGSRTVPSSISKNPQHVATSNHKEGKRNISSDNLPKNPQHANTSKQGEIPRTLASNISPISLQPVGSSKKRESARTLSSNSSSETLEHVNTSKQGKSAKSVSTKSQSPSLNKEPSDVDKQLVPYQRQFENPTHGRYIPTVFSPRVPSFMPTSVLENRPTEEIIATKKMTIFPGGVSQEEYSITRTAFYKCSWCPLGVNLDNPFCLAHRQSFEAVLESNRNNSWCPDSIGGSIYSESLSEQNIDNDNTWGPIGGVSPRSEFRPNLGSPCYSGGVNSSQTALRPNRDSMFYSGSRISSESVSRQNLDSPWYSGSRISSESVSRQNLDSPWYSGSRISTESVTRQNLDSPWYSGSRTSFESASWPNVDNHSNQHSVSSLVLHQPQQNQVSDVRTKFESMNILP